MTPGDIQPQSMLWNTTHCCRSPPTQPGDCGDSEKTTHCRRSPQMCSQLTAEAHGQGNGFCCRSPPVRLLDWQSAIHHAGNTGCMARHHIVAEVSNAVTRLWRLWDWQAAIHPGNTCCTRDTAMTHCCNLSQKSPMQSPDCGDCRIGRRPSIQATHVAHAMLQ